MTVIDLNLIISYKTRLNTTDRYDHTESIIMTAHVTVFVTKQATARPVASY